MADGPAPGNCLLAALPRRDWEGMRPHFREVELPLGRVLVEAGEPFRELYFPATCVVATVASFEDTPTIEMATVGREGMAGIGAALGSDTALSRHVVQMPGAALVVGGDAFERLAHEVPAFRRVLLAYAQAFLVQVMQSVACNGVHPVEARAARGC
jgi:hypothetical protein